MPINNKKNKEEECNHEYAPLMAKHKGEIIPLEKARVCLNCGIMKVGLNTIQISSTDGIQMDDKPIIGASNVEVNGELKIPTVAPEGVT